MRWTKNRCGVDDSGYTGIQKLQSNLKLPKKSRTKAINGRAIAAESKNFLRECLKRKCDR